MDFDSDGVRLHYEVHGPESGAPIVLVHGFASHYRLNWVGTRWQETLTGAGFRVIGLDCRGHGDSDKPHDPRAYETSVMAADVERLLDHLGIEDLSEVKLGVLEPDGTISIVPATGIVHRSKRRVRYHHRAGN